MLRVSFYGKGAYNMSEWLNQVFSSGVSLDRINPVGMVLMILSVVLIVVAKPVSGRWFEGKSSACNGIKLCGLLVCALGAGIAIL